MGWAVVVWTGSSDPCGQLMAWLGLDDLGHPHSPSDSWNNLSGGSEDDLAMYLLSQLASPGLFT